MADISEELDLFIRMACPVSGLFVTRFDPQFNITYTNAPNRQLISTIFLLGTNEDRARLAEASQIKIPDAYDKVASLFTNRLGLAWISEARIEDSRVKEILVLGPAFLNRYSIKELEDELYRLRLSLSMRRAFMDEISKMPVLTLNRLYEYGIMFHYCITGDQISISDFIYPQETSDDSPGVYSQDHLLNYTIEQEMMRLIEEGNMNFQKEFDVRKLSCPWTGSDNEEMFSQAKNMVVMNTTLASRAAISGGMSPQASLSLRESFIQETGRAKELGALNEINARMINTYIKRVHMIRLQEGVSPQIQKVCDYICSHLDEKIEVSQLSQMLGYTDYYFTKKFKKEIGMTLKEYIAEKKISAARDYLRNTPMRINEIAEALGYVNQGYFCDVFRKATGVSPSDYRAGKGT